MGPTLWSFVKSDTKYSIKMLPIGGSCMYEGEDGLESKEGESSPGAFPNANVWARISSVAAGPIFNIILAFIIALIMVNVMDIREPIASQVLEGSAAMEAGMEDGDRIVSINGKKIYLYEELTLFTISNRDKEAALCYERDGVQYETTLTPRWNDEYGSYMIGISNMDFRTAKGLEVLSYAWYEVRYYVKYTYTSLGMILQGRVTTQDVAGPVGIASIVGETYEVSKQYGWQTVLLNMMNFTLILSVNLGILNLLPVPALDGGRLVFLIFEVIRGKPVPPDKEGMVHFIGLMFFMILMVFLLFNDIRNIFLR